jgi:YD repeat-containing protein
LVRAISGPIGFDYDSDFRVAAESVNSDIVRFAYDADDLPTCASRNNCASDDTSAFRITWDLFAPRPTSLSSATITETRTYNEYGELASIQANTGSQLLYRDEVDAPIARRDGLGRVTVKTEHTQGDLAIWSYAYDARGRLEEVTKDGELYERLEYDANGNRLSRTTPATIPNVRSRTPWRAANAADDSRLFCHATIISCHSRWLRRPVFMVASWRGNDHADAGYAITSRSGRLPMMRCMEVGDAGTARRAVAIRSTSGTRGGGARGHRRAVLSSHPFPEQPM